MKRTILGALALLVVIASSTACGSDGDDPATAAPTQAASPTQTVSPAPTVSPSQSAPPGISVKGRYVAVESADASTSAFAYDQKLVPPSAGAEVALTAGNGRTKASLKATGFLPNRTYGAHLHVKPCAIDPKAAGPHFQHEIDPVATGSPSVDPAYANSQNEVWLDFTTDAAGNADATADVPWELPADRQPRSLIVHAEKTQTEAGKAGTAGARVSCLTLTT